MANLKLVADAMFSNKVKWSDISDEEKELCFFIFNRYFAKRFLEKSQLLNLKTIDKVVAMDMWCYYMKGKPYPNWFWSKTEKAEKTEISEKDFKLLLDKLKIKDIDLIYLIDNHMEFIKEELKYYKSLQKEK
jgi:hypothetical protein